MKILIVDDEINARAALKGMICSNFPNMTIVGEAEDVPQAVRVINQLKPDVVLLDIEMPGYLGIDLLDFFDPKQVNFKVIFITAYNDYAIKAFELAAVDYLLKPTRIEQLQRAFNRISSSVNNENANYLVLKDNLNSPSLSKIAFQTADGLVICKLENIRYLKADSAYTHIHFTNRPNITVTKVLQEYNILEETGSFFRVNRSYIINIHCVAKISKKDGGYVIMDNGEEISASLEKRNQLYSYFRDSIF